VIRPSVIPRSVILPLVIRPSVFRRSIIRRSVSRRSVARSPKPQNGIIGFRIADWSNFYVLIIQLAKDF
jgi:hypothetical protein